MLLNVASRAQKPCPAESLLCQTCGVSVDVTCTKHAASLRLVRMPSLDMSVNKKQICSHEQNGKTRRLRQTHRPLYVATFCLKTSCTKAFACREFDALLAFTRQGNVFRLQARLMHSLREPRRKLVPESVRNCAGSRCTPGTRQEHICRGLEKQ